MQFIQKNYYLVIEYPDRGIGEYFYIISGDASENGQPKK
jgi:hypothetical protein